MRSRRVTTEGSHDCGSYYSFSLFPFLCLFVFFVANSSAPPLGSPVMRGVALGCLVPLLAAGLVPSAAPEPASADEKLLRDNKAPTDGPALLEYLRKRFESP